MDHVDDEHSEIIDTYKNEEETPQIAYDEADYINRDSVKPFHRPTQAELLDCFFIFMSILTYIGDITTDILLSHKLYVNKNWMSFGLVVSFLIFPSIILQLLSSRWYCDDMGRHHCCSIITHILQLGPVERFMVTVYRGLRSRVSAGGHTSDGRYELYLENWRDVCMLRFFESFLEGAPQVLIQLYILSQYEIAALRNNWLNVVSVAVSIVAIAWSIVTYSYVKKLCDTQNTYSLCGYFFQVLYRIFMLTSRVMALFVFTMEFKWIIVPIIFIHWLLMIYWLSNVRAEFCLGTQNTLQRYCFEQFFICILGFVYIFCFINHKEGETRVRVTLIYSIFLLENSILTAVWLTSVQEHRTLHYLLAFLVWGCFVLGIVCMLLHYRYFHPNMHFTQGWFDCCTNRMVLEDGSEEDESEDEGTSVKRQLNMQGDKNNANEAGVKVELSPRRKIHLSDKGSHRNDEDLLLNVAKRLTGVGVSKSTSQRCNDFDYSGLTTQQFV